MKPVNRYFKGRNEDILNTSGISVFLVLYFYFSRHTKDHELNHEFREWLHTKITNHEFHELQEWLRTKITNHEFHEFRKWLRTKITNHEFHELHEWLRTRTIG